jgi:pyridoxal phosphate enzyme (YggS family)
MGVSKFHGLEALETAWTCGIRLFGESRVQEGASKFPGFLQTHPDTELHMIGPLQRNKVKAAVNLFDWIQSVDRDELLRDMGKFAQNREQPLGILLELHTAEDSKTGYPDTESLYRAAELAGQFPLLQIRGLMTIAPNTGDQELIRQSFRYLRAAQGELEQRFPSNDWSCLSMGMSGDYEIGIEEGSTLVRIGTALFGERN